MLWHTGGIRISDIPLFKVRNGERKSEPSAGREREAGVTGFTVSPAFVKIYKDLLKDRKK